MVEELSRDEDLCLMRSEGDDGGLTSEAPCREPLSEGHRHPSCTDTQQGHRLRLYSFPAGLILSEVCVWASGFFLFLNILLTKKIYKIVASLFCSVGKKFLFLDMYLKTVFKSTIITALLICYV